MAQALGVRVIAEGVTSDEQRKTLLEIGCEVVQGYFLGRPMRAEDFEFFLAEKKEKSDANGVLHGNLRTVGRSPAA